MDWFPVTDLPTLPPPLVSTPTPSFFPTLGTLIFQDTFKDPSVWNLAAGTRGSTALGLNELTIAINQTGTYLSTTRTEPQLSDFYLEVDVQANLCAGLDEFGILLRVASQGDFYRFSISCNGQMRMDLIRGGTATSPLPWTPSAAIPRNAPSLVKIGVWASGDIMFIFLNGNFHTEVASPFILAGGMGFFARSAGENAVTVNFSNLSVWNVQP